MIHTSRSWCPSLVLTGTLWLTLRSIPCGSYTRGRSRAFGVDLCIVGWGYFLLPRDDQYTHAYPNRAVKPVPGTPEPRIWYG